MYFLDHKELLGDCNITVFSFPFNGDM